jgi:hypothetical protein
MTEPDRLDAVVDVEENAGDGVWQMRLSHWAQYDVSGDGGTAICGVRLVCGVPARSQLSDNLTSNTYIFRPHSAQFEVSTGPSAPLLPGSRHSGCEAAGGHLFFMHDKHLFFANHGIGIPASSWAYFAGATRLQSLLHRKCLPMYSSLLIFLKRCTGILFVAVRRCSVLVPEFI